MISLFVALEHLGFLYLEMFLWTKTAGQKIFGNSREDAEKTKVLAANQGLYNGFIAAGLIWGLVHPVSQVGYQIQLFFLACVMIAGIYGGITARKSIFLIQGLPALIGAILVTFLMTSA
ncbi:MAG: DUF1304 domain-containing protein [Acidobacteria bacterium]|nr:MAG: DUF1304 domain-containing protein [Acidobacteriota bacterium]